MKTISHVAAAGLLVLGTLAGCSRSEPDEAPPTANAAVEAPAPVEDMRAPEPRPAPAEPAEAPAARPPAPPPAADVPPDEQMLDDADATGMTARATRDESDSDAATDPATAPANETEEK